MFRSTALLALACLVSGCGDQPKRESWAGLANEFVYTSLANSPVSATQVGYHLHNGVRLDAELDNLSEQEHDRQMQWYRGLRLRIAHSVDPSQLSADDRADFDIVNGQIALALLELEDIRSDRHNPTLYVELAGNALYSPFVLDYAPKAERYRHIVSRLEKLPALFEQARNNLVSSPEVWTRTAIAENEGNIALVNEEMRQGCPPELRAAYDQAAGPALAALRNFQRYLGENLIHRGYDWRLGEDLYARKFRLALASDQSPGQALAAAETTLREVRQQMLDIATPFYRKLHPDSEGERDLNKVVGEVLADISKRHATPETYFSNARRDLEEARQFVRARDLLTLPARDNLQVIETPEFMRGIYSVGGFSQAPALEPQLGAFYWITPIPKDWPAQRVESKLREYNDYGLKLLTLHEAMPGHYVQLEYSNDIQPQLRRVLRSVYRQRRLCRGLGGLRHRNDVGRGLSRQQSGTAAYLS